MCSLFVFIHFIPLFCGSLLTAVAEPVLLLLVQNYAVLTFNSAAAA